MHLLQDTLKIWEFSGYSEGALSPPGAHAAKHVLSCPTSFPTSTTALSWGTRRARGEFPHGHKVLPGSRPQISAGSLVKGLNECGASRWHAHISSGLLRSHLRDVDQKSPLLLPVAGGKLGAACWAKKGEISVEPSIKQQ